MDFKLAMEGGSVEGLVFAAAAAKRVGTSAAPVMVVLAWRNLLREVIEVTLHYRGVMIKVWARTAFFPQARVLEKPCPERLFPRCNTFLTFL